MRPEMKKSSTIIFDATFFKPSSLASVPHSIFSFIIIATNVGSVLIYPVGITFHHLFLYRMNNTSL